jgi:hypothetical protein
MDIFTPKEISKEEKITRGVNTLVKFNNEALQTMINNAQTAFYVFWNNEDATPQEICDLFGNNAYKLFENYGLIVQLILTLKPDTILPTPPNQFTINPDGTVTIIPNPEPIEPPTDEQVAEPIIIEEL